MGKVKFTLGEIRCNVRNNDKNNEASKVRKQIAEIIDKLEKERGDRNINPASKEKQRLISLAQDKLEEACLFAVKSLYTKCYQ